LTQTQRRKLQRLWFQENKEKEWERQNDKMFNLYRPMVPQGKVWRIKTSNQVEPVKRVEEAVKSA
jgi:superfamily II helicase